MSVRLVVALAVVSTGLLAYGLGVALAWGDGR